MLRAREVGWDIVRERHRKVSSAFIDAMGSLSLESFPRNPSSAVQAFILPDGCDGAGFLELLRSRHGIIAAGGQGALRGKIIRTGFLGHLDGGTLLRIVGAVGATLSELGINANVTEAEVSIKPVSDLHRLF